MPVEAHEVTLSANSMHDMRPRLLQKTHQASRKKKTRHGSVPFLGSFLVNVDLALGQTDVPSRFWFFPLTKPGFFRYPLTHCAIFESSSSLCASRGPERFRPGQCHTGE